MPKHQPSSHLSLTGRTRHSIGRERSPQTEHERALLGQAIRSPVLFKLLRQATTHLGQDGEDVVAETLVRLCTPEIAAKYTTSKGSPAAFALGIAARVAMEFRRRRRRNVQLQNDRESASMPVQEESARADERWTLVKRELARLGGKDQEIIHRRFACSSEPGTLTPRERVRLSRALAFIRHALNNA